MATLYQQELYLLSSQTSALQPHKVGLTFSQASTKGDGLVKQEGVHLGEDITIDLAVYQPLHQFCVDALISIYEVSPAHKEHGLINLQMFARHLCLAKNFIRYAPAWLSSALACTLATTKFDAATASNLGVFRACSG